MTREEALKGHWTLATSYTEFLIAVDDCDVRFVPEDIVEAIYEDDVSANDTVLNRLRPVLSVRDVLKFAIAHGFLDE